MSAFPFGAGGYSICVLVISIMVAAGGIILGFGYVFNDKRFKEFGKNELVQSAINGALVGGFMLMFANGGIVTTAVNSLALQNGTAVNCPGALSANAAICFAYNYLVSPQPYTFMGSTNISVMDYVIILMPVLYLLYAVLGLFSVFLAPILSQIKYVTQALTTVAISASVQAAVLTFIAASTLTLILPTGLLLRTFLPTRKLGGFLIALSIGFYVIFPLSYVFNAAILNSYSLSAYNSTNEVTLMSSNIQNTALQDYNSTRIVSQAANQSVQEALHPFSSFASDIVNAMFGFMQKIFNLIAFLILYAFILPVFSLVITGISIRELSRLFGSEGINFKLGVV